MGDDEKKAFWDGVLQFHETAGKDYPGGEAGRAAIRTIRRILGPYWQPTRSSGATPFSWPQLIESRLWVIHEPNYRWLIHFAKKLETLGEILGYQHVLEQFSIPDRYPTALMEMDSGIKIKLAGIRCKYDFQRSIPTPDLVAEIDGKDVDIEVTSLARPTEDTAGMEAMSSVISIGLQGRCLVGGIWARLPSRPELERIKSKVQAAVVEAKTERKLVEVNEPGVLSCLVAPEDMAAQVQASWKLGSFVMRTPTRLPKRDRLARTVDTKAKDQLMRGRPSVLVVYDRFSSPDEARAFLNEKELELSIGAFSDLAGVIVVCPFTVTGLMTEQERPPAQVRKETKEGRTLIEYMLPDGEAEICTVWRHPMGKHHEVIERVLHCLEDFTANLNQLYGV